MFCKNCGNEIKSEAKFCDKCGTQIINGDSEHQNTDIVNGDNKEINKTDKEIDEDWEKMSTPEKVIGIIECIISFCFARHLFILFGFSISSTGIFLSILMFFYCFILSASILAFPLWIVERIIKWLIKIPTEKMSISKIVLSIIAIPVMGIISYLSILRPFLGILLFIILGVFGYLKERLEGNKGE